MVDSIAPFGQRAHACVDRLVRRLNRAKRPRLIYHFTNDAGLTGIVEKGSSGSLTLASSTIPSELGHDVKPALRRIEDASQHSNDVEPLRRFLGENLSRIAHFFTCSLSRESDDLGQWRAYGDIGRGYAIGFYARALETAFNARPGGHSQSFTLEYSERILRRLQLQIAELCLPLVSAPRGRGL